MNTDILYQSGKTIFTANDLRILWQKENPDALKSGIKYLVDTNRLIRLRKGVYTLTRDYDRLELAQKLISPSYISLDTALQKYGIIFQANDNITSLASYTRILNVDGKNYQYHSVKEEILLNPLGIQKKERYFIATPERAIADWLYLRGEAYFDHLKSLDKELLFQMSRIYGQKSTEERINKLISTV